MTTNAKSLVVCGPPSGERIRQSVMPHLDFPLQIVETEFKEELLEAVALHQPPLCVVEWQIPVLATRKDEAALLAEGAPAHMARAFAGAQFDTIPAYQVFEEAVNRSPNTQFIIACHNRGYDVPKAREAEFMQHPSAIKRMGFINGLPNMRYLAKLFTRTYAGRTWKPTF